MSVAEGAGQGKWGERGCGALAGSRLTGGPEVAPRVHSDLAGQAAGVREIPAEPGGTGSEHSEEQEATDPMSAPRPQGHGSARTAPLPLLHGSQAPAQPAFKPALLGEEPARGARPWCPRPHRTLPAPSSLSPFLSFGQDANNLQASTPAPLPLVGTASVGVFPSQPPSD